MNTQAEMQRTLEGVVSAAALRRENRLADAEALCLTLLDTDRPHPSALIVMAETAASGGRIELLIQVVPRLALAARDSRYFDQYYRFAGTLLPQGALSRLSQTLADLAQRDMANFDLQCILGRLLELQDRPEEALGVYERALALNPHYAFIWSRRAVLALQRSLGEPLEDADKRQGDGPAGTTSMSTLGSFGRFGNQLQQYGFLRAYGAARGLRIEVPVWIGRYLFDLCDPPPAKMLRGKNVKDLPLAEALAQPGPETLAGLDAWGFFQYPTQCLRPQQEFFRRLYRPGRNLRYALAPLTERLGVLGGTLVALHLRRGDFGTKHFWIAPESWYLDWLKDIWPRLERPRLYLASDDPALVSAFSAYSPLTAADLAEPIAGAEFYTDFHMLRSADLVAISNSSFSFLASMLNEKAQAFLRPDPQRKALVAFDPWNAEFFLPG